MTPADNMLAHTTAGMMSSEIFAIYKSTAFLEALYATMLLVGHFAVLCFTLGMLRVLFRSARSAQVGIKEADACSADLEEKKAIIAEIKESLFKVHGGIDMSKKPVAIEVDGPSHFYVNSNEYTAYSKLKRRILSRMGFRVVNVPYFEWNKLKSVKEKEGYILRKVDEAVHTNSA